MRSGYTTIDLCLALFPWVKIRRAKGAVKLHTLLDLKCNIPSFLHVSPGNIHDVNVLDQFIFEAGAFYVIDRSYIDFERLYSRPVEKTTGLRCDQTIVLTGFLTWKSYPDKIRRVKYYDREHDLHLTFLTNNFTLSPSVIAQLYKSRWQIELFFRWIKQHLRIKSFYGTSPNAVRTQVWIATTVYVLIAIMMKRLHLDNLSLYTILQILSVTLFQKEPIYQVLTASHYRFQDPCPANQLLLFDF